MPPIVSPVEKALGAAAVVTLVGLTLSTINVLSIRPEHDLSNLEQAAKAEAAPGHKITENLRTLGVVDSVADGPERLPVTKIDLST